MTSVTAQILKGLIELHKLGVRTWADDCYDQGMDTTPQV